MLYKSRIWFAGIGINPTIKLKEAEYFVYEDMNYTLITGAELPLSKKFQLYSTLLAASDFSNANTFDLMMQVKFKEIVYVGGALSTGNAFLPDNWQAIAGVVIAKKCLVHYGFGQPISDLNNQKSFIHNFSMVYSFSR